MNYLIAIAIEDGTYQYHVVQANDEQEAFRVANNFLEAIKEIELWDYKKHGCKYEGPYTEGTYINVVSPIKT